MALIEYDIFGDKRDKVARAIEIAKSFCPQEGYYLGYSGGKDSTVVRAILDMAGVPYDAHYNVTTVDPPELVKFIISQYEAVIYQMKDGAQKHFIVQPQGKLLNKAKPEECIGKKTIYFSIPTMTMRELIVKKQMPPTRLQRYCCQELKETNGQGRVVVTGVRARESANRKQNSGTVVIFDGKTGTEAAERTGANFTQTVRGGWY